MTFTIQYTSHVLASKSWRNIYIGTKVFNKTFTLLLIQYFTKYESESFFSVQGVQ